MMSDSEVEGGVEREAGDWTGSVSAGLCRRGEMETTTPGTQGAVEEDARPSTETAEVSE